MKTVHKVVHGAICGSLLFVDLKDYWPAFCTLSKVLTPQSHFQADACNKLAYLGTMAILRDGWVIRCWSGWWWRRIKNVPLRGMSATVYGGRDVKGGDWFSRKRGRGWKPGDFGAFPINEEFRLYCNNCGWGYLACPGLRICLAYSVSLFANSSSFLLIHSSRLL